MPLRALYYTNESSGDGKLVPVETRDIDSTFELKLWDDITSAAITRYQPSGKQDFDLFCRKGCISLGKEGGFGRKKRKDLFFDNEERIICRKAHIDVAMQFVVPASLIERMLYISLYLKAAGHSGDRKLFYYLRHKWNWPSMSLDCYTTARACPECTKTRIKVHKHTSWLNFFLASRPLEFVGIGRFIELPRTPREKGSFW